MKKKAFSLLLVFVMVLPTFVTALAADTNPPMWQQLGYESKEDFCYDYAYLGEGYDTDDGQQSLSEETYDQLATIFTEQLKRVRTPEYAKSRGYDSIEAWYEAEDSSYYTSVDEMIVDIAFEETLESYFARWEIQHSQTERKRLGLRESGVSVMLNGKAVTFADALPEYANGATYVPVRQTAEAFGGEIGFENETQTVTITKGSTILKFPLGGMTMTAESEADSRAVLLPAAVYERAGASYIPVRAFAEALGYEVYWDESYETAVILDKAAVAAVIDEDFTVVNRMFANRGAEDMTKTRRTAIDIVGTLTAFDTINGNQENPVSANIEVVSRGQNFQVDVKLDLEDLLQWFTSQLGSYAYDDDEAQVIFDAIKKPEAQLIVNYDEDTIYLRSPTIIGMVVKMQDQITVPGGAAALSENAWYKIEHVGLKAEEAKTDILGLGGAGVSQTAKLLEDNASSMGSLIYTRAIATAYPVPSVYFCEQLEKQTAQMRAVVGDRRFTQNGTSATLEIDLQKLDAENEDDACLIELLEAIDATEFAAKITISESGTASGTVRVHDKSEYDAAETLTTMTFQFTRRSADMMMTYHLKNTSELKLNIKMNASETNGQETFTPPEGALIINLNALLES